MNEEMKIVSLPGSESWENAYKWGQELDKKFPNQDAEDFASACDNNDYGPTQDKVITDLKMVHQGSHDGSPWVWLVTCGGILWVAAGGCDYTGWDCQSDLNWMEAGYV